MTQEYKEISQEEFDNNKFPFDIVETSYNFLFGQRFDGYDLQRINFKVYNNYWGFQDVRSANLTNCDFSNMSIKLLDFSDSELSGANFANTTLIGCDFTKANLTGANFQNAKIYKCFFNSAILNGSNFNKADIQNVFFIDAQIEQVDFSQAFLGARTVKFE
jgi:uncharacterized protein YjbI with pentapeptide repeats